MTIIETPVLIIGGGGVGLSCSIMLSDLGIDHILVERRPAASGLPKAHLLNQKTMEVFRQHGLADELTRVGGLLRDIGTVRWKTSMSGDGPFDGRLFQKLDCFGGGTLHAQYAADSPTLNINLPQCRLEPLLREYAEARATGQVLFGHEAISLTQSEDHVDAVVRRDADGETLNIRAQYVVGADGGRFVGASINATMEGLTGLMTMLSIHFSADLSAWWESDTVMTWFLDPMASNSYSGGCLVSMGPTWGSGSEEWALSAAARADEDRSDPAIIARVRELLHLPDLAVTVHRTNLWSISSVVADRYGEGRVFLAGDAAHQHSPATGLGLNMGIQDAQNIAWKLAKVLQGRAPDTLLDSYEEERRPVANRNVQWATFGSTNQDVLLSGLGVVSVMPPAMRERAVSQYFEESPIGATRRARAAEIFNTQRITYQAHDLELGFHYERGALVADGTVPPVADPMGSIYHPTTRPGHRLPHAWLRGAAGGTVSTHDFSGGTRDFVLFVSENAERWQTASQRICDRDGDRIIVCTVDGHDWQDIDGTWAALREVDADGAILVRPDNIVAWRTKNLPESIDDALRGAMSAILRGGAKLASLKSDRLAMPA